MRFILKRLGIYTLSLFGVLFVVFIFLYKVPGDPVITMLGFNATQEDKENLRKALGLDRPVTVQYVIFCRRLFTLDLGRSVIGDFDIGKELKERLPRTFLLAFLAFLMALFPGIFLGVGGALNKKMDVFVRTIVIFAGSFPVFYLAFLSLWLFGYKLGWISVSGSTEASSVFLPAFILSISPMAVIARITNVSLRKTMREYHYLFLYSMGISKRILIWKYGLREILVSIISTGGNIFIFLFGGTFFVESIFGYPGIGLLGVDAMLNFDYPVIQDVVALTAMAFLVVNFLTDILYAWSDPRVRRYG